MFQNSGVFAFWLVTIIALALTLSWFYYFWRKDQNIFTTSVKWSLFGLRALVLAIIGLLMLGLVFPKKSKRTELANLFFLIDQSKSMLNYSDSAQVRNLVPKIIESARDRFSGKFLTRFIHFSDEVLPSDSLRFDGASTNLGSGFAHIRDLYVNNNIGAIVLISDGNYNEGVHPRYESEKIKFTPVYSVAVGDTLTKRDAMIMNIVSNNIAFSGNIFPIKFEAKASKMAGKKLNARLMQGNNVLHEKTFQISDNNAFLEHSFLVEAKGRGIQSYRVELQSEVQEYTLSNNSRSVYVEILDSKRKATIVVGGLHPDAGALQSVLQKDQNTDVSIRFLNEIHEIPKTDLLILIDVDFAQNPSLYKALSNSNTPYILFVHPNMVTANLNLGLSGHSPGRADFVSGQFNEDFSLIQFSEVFKQRLKDWPPVAAPFARDMKPIGQPLLYQKVSTIATDKPLMTFTNRGNQKIAYFYGDGIWRWRLWEYNRYQDNRGFEELWDKTLQYLTVKENLDKLRVFPPSRMTVKDELRFRAEFYNDAYQAIVTPQIALTLKDENGKIVGNYTFTPLTRDYELNIGKLNPGLYRWEASTTFNGVKYQKNGEFILEDSSLESQDLSANYDVLLELSDYSDGKFYALEDWEKMLDDIEANEQLSSAQFDEINYANLIDLKWIFVLLVTLVFAEWFLRRWFGSY
jgi:hypothetical protein